MRIFKLSAAAATAAASLLALTGTAQAQSGTITFSGLVVPNTCNVQVSGTGAMNVRLQPVLVENLDAVGETTGATPFELQLTNCDAALGDETATLALSGGGGTANGLLDNTAVGGSNAVVQVTLPNGTPINLTAVAGAQAIPTQDITNNAATFPLSVQYYATSATTTAGLVTSSVNYAITYE